MDHLACRLFEKSWFFFLFSFVRSTSRREQLGASSDVFWPLGNKGSWVWIDVFECATTHGHPPVESKKEKRRAIKGWNDVIISLHFASLFIKRNGKFIHKFHPTSSSFHVFFRRPLLIDER